MNTDFTALDFHQGLPSHNLIDKKSEVRINIGRVGSLPPAHMVLRQRYGPILMGVQSCGMDQDRLDQTCRALGDQCKAQQIEILITKSDRPFDSQWYFFGDIDQLLTAAQDEMIRLPFTQAVHHPIYSAINAILRHNPPS